MGRVLAEKIAVLFAGMFIGILFLPQGLAAHFIVGKVNAAYDGTSADGLQVILWNPSRGIADNVTDIIGESGNSGTPEIYMIDCELLSTPCTIDDRLNVQVLNNGSDYFTLNYSLIVTGAGYDLVPELRINSPPKITSWTVDDSFSSPANEIDLTPLAARLVTCEGVITDYDGDGAIVNASAEFFDRSASSYGGANAKNKHYTNSTCFLDRTYGNGNQAYTKCSFQVMYYANSAMWNCTVRTEDNLSTTVFGSNGSFVNPLLAISVDPLIDFGAIQSLVTQEVTKPVENAGNVQVNLSLSGYGNAEGDGFAMRCIGNTEQNISIDRMKYNLTYSNAGSLDDEAVNLKYENLTSAVRVRPFDLNVRQNDAVSDAIKNTYWRVSVPSDISGNCSGNIIFGAARRYAD